MITYSNKLYTSDSIKKIDSIKRKIKYGHGQARLYLITLSNNGDNQLDIFHNAMLKQRLYRKFDLKVVGLSNSYDEALLIVEGILNDSLKETGSADMKSYLLKFFD